MTAAAPTRDDVLGGTQFFDNPYPVYARLRARPKPAFNTPTGSWLITRYAAVEALLREARVSKNIQRAEPTPLETSVLFQDPPDHTRVRGLLNEAFSRSAVAGIENRIRDIADALIDRMREQGARRADFIAGFALPLPVTVIAELLGVPPADAPRLHNWSTAFIVEESVPQAESERQQYAAIAAMAKYFEGLVAQREASPGDDVLGALIRARLEGERLSRRELIGNCILLTVAGHETTVNLLGNGIFLLLQDRERFERVRLQPGLLPAAIEEMLRYESPVQLGTFRVTTEPVESGGCILQAGSMVTAVLGSANRDPDQFPEPDRFDLTRSPNRHLAFGMGPHRCLGASLARMEARIGFAALLERLPDLRLDPAPSGPEWLGRIGSLPWLRRVDRRPQWRTNAVTRGLRRLVVSW